MMEVVVDRAWVVIDRSFEVLLWNEQAENLWGLREEEEVRRTRSTAWC